MASSTFSRLARIRALRGVGGLQIQQLRQIAFENKHKFIHTAKRDSKKMSDQTDKSDKSDLRNRLTPIQYHVTQEKGTERPFSGCYNKFYEPGTYACIVCNQPLFTSETKYDSGCGWPAFNDVLDKGRVKLAPDTSGVGANLLLLISQPGRVRTEVTCSQCGAHLGHVFDDGPAPTRKRFCINSASLNFIPSGGDAKQS